MLFLRSVTLRILTFYDAIIFLFSEPVII